MIHLDLDDLLHIARRTLADVEVRDVGLLDAAVARPRATVFGEDAYPSIHAKAAALLHSIARGHPLVDGNKRLALASTIAFYGVNGLRLTLSNDDAYDLVIAVAAGEIDDVPTIAARLEAGTSRVLTVGNRRPTPHTGAPASSTRRHSALTCRSCWVVRTGASSSSGLRTTTARALARETATLSRFRS